MLSHLDERGQARMVDVGSKPATERRALARAVVRVSPQTAATVARGEAPKGDVLGVARIAGIQAAKQTPHLIPLCHQIALSSVSVDFMLVHDGVTATATANTTAQTGVEMEALTAVTVSLLTIYDMCKAVDKTMRLEGIHLARKTKS